MAVVVITPRPYQIEAVDAVFDHLVIGSPERGGAVRRTLLVMGTGSGKTVIFSWVIARWLNEHPGQRVLVLVDREELVTQTLDKLRKASGLTGTVEKAERRADRSCAVTVSTVQTMSRRLGEWAPHYFGLIIADEAHLSTANTWQSVLNHFSSAKTLGCTATPFRSDKKDLLEFYETICYEYGTFKLIEHGWLCRVRVRTIPLQIDLSDLEKRTREKHRADYDADDIDQALTPWYEAIAREICRYAADRKSLVFLPLVRSSQRFAALLCDCGLTARHIDGNSPNRAELIAAFARNEFQVLCNANLLTTGFDDPAIDCIVNLRLTKSFVLANQILGRGTRLHPGKSDLLYLDFLWQYDKLTTKPKKRIVRPADLVSSEELEAGDIQQLLEESEQLDLLDAKTTVAEARQRKLLQALKSKRRARPGYFDVMDVINLLQAFDLAEYEPLAEWEHSPVSEAQAGRLDRAGIDPSIVANRGHASALIGKLEERRNKGLCTIKQARSLQRFGYRDAVNYTFEQASTLLGKLLG